MVNICALPTCLWLAATNHVQICIWSVAENNCSITLLQPQVFSSVLNVLWYLNSFLLMASLYNHMISVLRLIDFAIRARLSGRGHARTHSHLRGICHSINTFSRTLSRRNAIFYMAFFTHDALSYSKKSKSETMMHAMTPTSPQAKAKTLHKSSDWIEHNCKRC